jgi:hypothetical protein
MIKVGDLYTLKREMGITGYNLCDHYNKSLRKETKLIPATDFEKPFIYLGQNDTKNDVWVHVLVENKVGWINVDPEQLQKFIYR